MMNKKISVALCTYNGEQYIEEQLKSIALQTVLPLEIVVCDDCSSDNTLKIIRQMKDILPFSVSIHVNEDRLGIVNNFSKCIGLCEGDYVALCDQDDVWYPNKLEILIDKLVALEGQFSNKTPILVHSDLEVVDVNCNHMTNSYFLLQNIYVQKPQLASLILQNSVTGCACMFNRALIQYALPIHIDAMMHDWWLALIAVICGTIGVVNECTIKYRQHNNNNIGAKGYYSLHTLMKVINWKNLNQQMGRKLIQTMALEAHLKIKGVKIPNLLSQYNDAMNGTLVMRMKTVFWQNVYMKGTARNLVYFLLLIIGGYKKHIKRDK